MNIDTKCELIVEENYSCTGTFKRVRKSFDQFFKEALFFKTTQNQLKFQQSTKMIQGCNVL